MNELAVSTVVYVPPERAFSFLLDFPGYADYTEYLTEVRQDGDGSPGTRYDLLLSWWVLSYTARSEVTEIDPPDRIDWSLVGGLDATGSWLVEPVEDAATDGGHATKITLEATYDPGSVDDAGIDLPALVSTNWLGKKVAGVAQSEATTVVERIVADLEGEPRPVDLQVAVNETAVE